MDEIGNTPFDTKTTNSQYLTLAAALAKHFRVRVYRAQSFTGVSLGIIGLHTDVEIFKATFEYTYQAMRNCATRYVKSLDSSYNRLEKLQMKNTYVTGFKCGAQNALRENEAEHALMVIVPGAVVEYSDNKFAGSGRWHPSRKEANSAEAYSAGYKDGSAVLKNNKKQLASA